MIYGYMTFSTKLEALRWNPLEILVTSEQKLAKYQDYLYRITNFCTTVKNIF